MRVLLFSFLASSICLSAQATKFELDKAHTDVTFKAPHLMVSKVKGRFNDFSGSFDFDEKTMKVDNVMVTIKANSIDTNEKDRDKHLRSKDFLDADKFPELTFKGTKTIYEKDKPDKIEGDLTIRGVTKKVVLDVDYNGAVTDPMGNRIISFDASTKINRKDFGLNWNKSLDKGGWVVGDDLEIEIDGEAKEAKAAKASEPAKK